VTKPARTCVRMPGGGAFVVPKPISPGPRSHVRSGKFSSFHFVGDMSTPVVTAQLES